MSIDVNLKAREALVNEDGTPVLVWQRDEVGKRMGETKVQLDPNFTLVFSDGDVRLVAI